MRPGLVYTSVPYWRAKATRRSHSASGRSPQRARMISPACQQQGRKSRVGSGQLDSPDPSTRNSRQDRYSSEFPWPEKISIRTIRWGS